MPPPTPPTHLLHPPPAQDYRVNRYKPSNSQLPRPTYIDQQLANGAFEVIAQTASPSLTVSRYQRWTLLGEYWWVDIVRRSWWEDESIFVASRNHGPGAPVFSRWITQAQEDMIKNFGAGNIVPSFNRIINDCRQFAFIDSLPYAFCEVWTDCGYSRNSL